MTAPLKVVVLISGNGSNLQAIIDAVQHARLNIELSLVISNRPSVKGLQRAEQAGIPNMVIDHTGYADRASFDQALVKAIDETQADLVVLAGFMRILSDEFVNHYMGRLINIHPSLLPKYQGLNTHQRALDAGDAEHGATVHYVIPELDSGPVILQAKVPVHDNDTADSLAQRVHQAEHQLYPEAIRRIATSQVAFRNGMVYYDEQPISHEQQQYAVKLG